jgi:hypothetical protein
MSVDVNNVVSDSQPVTNPAWTMNYNPRQVSIAYIALMIEWHTGMGPLESNMIQKAKDQKIENKVMDDFIQFSSLVSQIEADGDSTGTQNAASIASQLQKLAQQMFGTGATFDATTGQLIPTKGSDLYNFMEVLNQNKGNAFNNPAYQQIESFSRLIFSSWTGKNINTDYKNGALPTNTIAEDLGIVQGQPGNLTDLTQWVNVFGFNYYNKMNPTQGTNAGTDYAGQSYVQTSASQNALSGINQENTAWMQTASVEDNSYDKIGQDIINSVTQLTQQMNENMR